MSKKTGNGARAAAETAEARRAHRAAFFHGVCFKCTGPIVEAGGAASFVEVIDPRQHRVRYHTACAPARKLAAAADESEGIARYSTNRVAPGLPFVDGVEDFLTAADAWCVLTFTGTAHCC